MKISNLNRTMTRLASLLLFAAIAADCTTLRSAFNLDGGKGSKSNKAKIPADAVVVMNAGRRLPILSPLSRPAWVEIHETTKSGALKFNSALAAGERDVAITEAKRHLQRYPRSEAALTTLAVAYVMKKKFGLALMHARILKKFHPNSSNVKNIEGIWTITQPKLKPADFRKAAELFEEALAQNSKNVAAALNLGNLYLNLGQADQAKEIYATAKVRCGNCSEARYGLGIALTRMSEAKAAESEFKAILAEDSKEYEALYRLALVAKNGYNDHELAKKYLSELLESGDPKDPVYRQGFIFMKRLKSLKAPQDAKIAKNNKRQKNDNKDDAKLLEASMGSD